MDSEILAVAEEVAMFIETQSIASNEQISLPTAITLYRIGRILYACIVNGQHTSVIDTFDTLMSALTLNGGYIRTVLLHELHLAYANLIVSFAANAKSSAISIPDESSLGLLMAEKTKYANNITICTANDVIEATESLCGIYLASETACRYCGSFESSSNETSNELDIVFISFAWVYEYFLSSDQSMIKIKENILKTISRLLVHGVVPETSNISEDEQLSSIMNTIQRIQSSGGEDSCAMGDMLRMEENCQDSFVKFLLDKFSDGAQLQYTMAMLRGFPHSDSKPSVSELTESKLMPSHEQISPPQKQNMTDIQIAHVRSVLPNLGEGFIEEALKCYNNDIERTLDALIRMSDDVPTIHSRLLSLPKNLPRKLKDMPEQYTANIDMHRGATIKDDGKEHVKRQKLYIKEVERQAEEEAYLVENVSRALGGLKVQEIENEKEEYFVSGNEYDDDYDDQYDGIGDDGGMAGGIGGMDEGLYDVDVHNVHQKYDKGGARNEQDMWRQYNKLIKNVDAESQFWVSLFVCIFFSADVTS